MSKILFLSHHPHDCHLTYAKAIGARIKVTPFNAYVSMMKAYPLLNMFYPSLSLIYSLFVRIHEDIILVEGSSSLFLACFIKMRKPNIKIAYIDCDLMFYNLKKSGGDFKGIFFKLEKMIKKIDYCISVSRQNQELAKRFLSCSVSVALPYPKVMEPVWTERRQYGLYIGRLDPDKNIKKIIEFGLNCPYFEKFIVVGDGLYTKYLQEIAGREPKLLYHRSKDNVAGFYSQCKFLIHLADYDCYPCTTMEAALCGCFPIIPQGVGTKDIFDEIFVVRDSNDAEEMNRKIKYILDNEENVRHILARNAENIIQKEQSVENFKTLFRKIEQELGFEKR